jgi:hypothetical protein
MKSRKTPDPSLYKSSLNTALHTDAQVVKWVQRLTGDPKARPHDLDETRLEFVMREVLALRGEHIDESLFHKAMIETCPLMAAPDWTDNGEDIGHVFAQPEMEAFWHSWQPAQKERGPRIDFFAAKAVLCTLAMTGATSQFDDALEMLKKDQSLREAFEKLEGRPLHLPPYSSLMKHVHRAATSLRPLAMQTNIDMIKQLAEMFPDMGFGENLAIDGMPFAAWVPQRGSRNTDTNAVIGRRIPQAGYRVYSHTAKGKKNITLDNDVAVSTLSHVKAWRGFYVVAIIDIASGLPLVWLTISATDDEARAIVPLLSSLYKLWPECPAKTIAGDSAWDEDPWCRLCEVDYGIAPIFRLHKSQRDQEKWDVLDDGSGTRKRIARDGQIWAITGKGQLVCGCHQKPLKYAGFDRAKRVKANGHPLLNGQTADERQFAVRGLCDHGPVETRLSLKAMTDWSRLTRYPHFASGDPKKYAKRQALLVRLNHVESLWNRLKSAGLGVQSADRIRTLPMDTIDAAVSLAFLGFTGLATADQRHRRKIGPYATGTASAAPASPTVVPNPAAPPAAVSAPAAASAAAPASARQTAPATPPGTGAPSLPAVTMSGSSGRRTVRVNGRIFPPQRLRRAA